MSFPISITGSFNMEKEFSGTQRIDYVGAHIESMLKHNNAIGIVRSGSLVTFKSVAPTNDLIRSNGLIEYGPGKIEASEISGTLVFPTP